MGGQETNYSCTVENITKCGNFRQYARMFFFFDKFDSALFYRWTFCRTLRRNFYRVDDDFFVCCSLNSRLLTVVESSLGYIVCMFIGSGGGLGGRWDGWWTLGRGLHVTVALGLNCGWLLVELCLFLGTHAVDRGFLGRLDTRRWFPLYAAHISCWGICIFTKIALALAKFLPASAFYFFQTIFL